MNRQFNIQKLNADVIVCGGGMGGVCAAIAAARQGMKTFLIQDRPVLGGNASSEIRVHIGGATDHGFHYDARESGIIEEIRLEYAARDPLNTYAWIDIVLLDFCKREPNLRLFLNTLVYDITVQQQKIISIEAIQSGSEVQYSFSGQMFVDGTGDGTIGYLAGAEYRMGREGKAEFHEAVAPDTPDNFTLGASILFRAEDMGKPIQYIPPQWAKKFTADDLKNRRSHQRTKDFGRYWHGSMNIGWWWIEFGGSNDSIHDNEMVREELQAIVLGLWDYIKNIDPKTKEDAQNFDITWVGHVPGKRETRRLIGDYILREADILNCTIFDDQIGVGGWSIDLHPPKGFYDSLPSSQHTRMDLPYSIPFRCIYSKNIVNLLIASRCLSVSHVAHGSTRLIATLAVVGQAAGVAAAICIKNHYSPLELYQKDMLKLQAILQKNDQFLLGIRDQDPQNLALTTIITTNSEFPCEFGSPTTFISIDFPIAQRFYLPFDHSPNCGPPLIYCYLKNESDEVQLIHGGVRQDTGREEFNAIMDLTLLTGEIAPKFTGWVALKIESSPFSFRQGGNFWIYLNDNPPVQWGINAWHYPGFRVGYYIEEPKQNRWQTLRPHFTPFYDDHIGMRGHFCFKIAGVPSPFPVKAIQSGESRPFIIPNLWISAPFTESILSNPETTNKTSSVVQPIEVTLEWGELKHISEIEIILDTDLDNSYPHMMHKDALHIKEWPIMGKSPTCIRDIDIEYIDTKTDTRISVANIRGNYQRCIKIKIPTPISTRKLILRPIANWGFHAFNLYQVKVY